MSVLKSAAYPYNTVNRKDFLVGNFGLRFHFNGMEMDNEVYGTGNEYDYDSRIYNPRLAKWLTCDSKERAYPSWSPYNAFMCNPIVIIDPDGKGGIVSKVRNPETGALSLKVTATIYVYTDVIKTQEEMNKITGEIKNNIETNWNNIQTADKTGNAVVTDANGNTVPVSFEIAVVPITRAEVEKQLKSGKVAYGDNYVELTEGTGSSFEGGNTGVFDINQHNDKGNTWAHEFGHLLGYETSKNIDPLKDNEFHANDYDPKSKLPVPIMYRDDRPLSSEQSLDCDRVVTQKDVDRLNKGKGVGKDFLGKSTGKVPFNIGTNNENKIYQNGVKKN